MSQPAIKSEERLRERNGSWPFPLLGRKAGLSQVRQQKKSIFYFTFSYSLHGHDRGSEFFFFRFTNANIFLEYCLNYIYIVAGSALGYTFQVHQDVCNKGDCQTGNVFRFCCFYFYTVLYFALIKILSKSSLL